MQLADAAQRYCTLIENRASLGKREFVRQCAELLPEIQMHLMHLQRIKIGRVPLDRDKRISHKEWQKLYRSLARKLTKDDLYYMVFNPCRCRTKDPITHTLADDLSDIYADLKQGLDFYDLGDPPSIRHAAYQWQRMFLIHTGHHIVAAMRPLQVLIESHHGISMMLSPTTDLKSGSRVQSPDPRVLLCEMCFRDRRASSQRRRRSSTNIEPIARKPRLAGSGVSVMLRLSIADVWYVE